MTYVFRCPECGERREQSDPRPPTCEGEHFTVLAVNGPVMTRDYRAESAHLSSYKLKVQREREGGTR